MPQMKVNDISMYYEIYGQGEPIVFLAGFSADHLTWSFILEYFTDQYQVVLLDNRGAGQTDAPPGPYTIEQMAHDTFVFCAQLGLSQAHFVGNSMGGYLVQMLAYRYPALVKSAVISNSVLIPQTCFNIYLAAQLALMKAGAPKEAIIKASFAWIFSFDFLSMPDQLENFILLSLSNPYPFSITAFEAQYHAVNHFDARTWAKEIKAPTLVTGSDQDLIFQSSQSEAIARQIEGAQYYCFEKCGHLPHIEHPEKYASLVKKFLVSIK